MSGKLCVGDLSFSTTSDDLSRLVAPHERVSSAGVVADTGRRRGFGPVELSPPDGTRAAIESLIATGSIDVPSPPPFDEERSR